MKIKEYFLKVLPSIKPRRQYNKFRPEMYYFIESEYYKNIHIYDGNKSSLLCGKESPKDLQDSNLKLCKSRKACFTFYM